MEYLVSGQVDKYTWWNLQQVWKGKPMLESFRIIANLNYDVMI